MSEAVIVMTTGGTFDVLGAAPGTIGPPAAPALLLAARATLEVHCIELMRRDSACMTDAERTFIRHAVRECPMRRIVIVHGTDTLTATAAELAGIAGKVIVLTGAFTPAQSPVGDAAFNLGGALVAVQLLTPGVHVCIGAEIYSAAECSKDPICRRFRRASP